MASLRPPPDSPSAGLPAFPAGPWPVPRVPLSRLRVGGAGGWQSVGGREEARASVPPGSGPGTLLNVSVLQRPPQDRGHSTTL